MDRTRVVGTSRDTLVRIRCATATPGEDISKEQTLGNFEIPYHTTDYVHFVLIIDSYSNDCSLGLTRTIFNASNL